MHMGGGEGSTHMAGGEGSTHMARADRGGVVMGRCQVFEDKYGVATGERNLGELIRGNIQI